MDHHLHRIDGDWRLYNLLRGEDESVQQVCTPTFYTPIWLSNN